MRDGDRQTGRTTAQIKAAPYGSVFVCPSAQAVHYARALAEDVVGRRDLQFVAPDWLERDWMGRELTGLAVDHAVKLTLPQRRGWDEAAKRVPKGTP